MSAWRETGQPDAGTSNSRCSQPNLNNLKNVCTTATSSLADLSRESRKPYRCSRSVDLTLRRSVETDPNEKKIMAALTRCPFTSFRQILLSTTTSRDNTFVFRRIRFETVHNGLMAVTDKI